MNSRLRTFCTSIYILTCLQLSGQTTTPPVTNLPMLLPPTPEAAAIVKSGQLSAGLFNGSAQVSIPIYEIKMKEFSVPIGINYNSNGVKVDEIPSRVGMGWTLAPSGVVARIVNGKPDDQSIRAVRPGANATMEEWELYYDRIVSPDWPDDSEADEFHISAPGISAKFIIDDQGQPFQIGHSNLKIEVLGGPGPNVPYSGFVITNTEGIKFRFGGTDALETTTSHNLIGKLIVKQSIRTAFYLKSIDMLNGEKINFNYSPINFRTFTGITQSVQAGLFENYNETCTCNEKRCPFGPLPETFTEHLSSIIYSSVYLSSITTSNGINIGFSYESRPDNSSDNRLKSILISGGSYFLKGYTLNYFDPPTNGYATNVNPMSSYNKRFFLKEIYTTVPKGELESEILAHSFEYIDIDNLPPRLSFSQDYHGYYNGWTNDRLLPKIIGEEDIWGGMAIANRNYDFLYSQKGMLSKITFPTKGYEKFNYEPNAVANYEQVDKTTTSSVSGSGTNNSNGVAAPMVWFGNTFNIIQNQTANISLNLFANPACSNCLQPVPGPEGDIKAQIEILNSSDNTVYTKYAFSFGTVNGPVDLVPGTYYLKLTVWGLPNAASGELRYDYSSGPAYHWVQLPAGGVRVKSIETYEPVTAKSTSKYFFYAKKESLNITSGKTLWMPVYKDATDDKRDCGYIDNEICPPPFDPPPFDHISCKFKTLHSSPVEAAFLFDNNHIAYEYVIEADDPNFVNGGIEHKFSIIPYTNREVILGYENKLVPNNTIANTNGFELETNYFDATKKVIKKIENTFETESSFFKLANNYSVRKRYPVEMFQPFLIGEYLDPFDVTRYAYQSYWIRNQATTVREFDESNKELIASTTYSYGAPGNILPIKIEATNSTGEVIKEERKYPTDLPAIEPYATMTSKNFISPIIETKTTTGTKELYTSVNNYKDFSANSNNGSPVLIRPENMQVKKGVNGNLESRILFNKYDSKGNPISLRKANDINIVYVLGYENDLVIAEVKNASENNIAYSNFETTQKGYWEYEASNTISPSAPMGQKVYSLSNGSITRSNLDDLKKYKVTYWSYGGSAFVNGNMGSSIVTKNGWTLYEHRLSPQVTAVTISGTVDIDELRLYPLDAQMVTYTHYPFLGISSVCSINDQIIYYGYDGGMRLKEIRDADRNIIKAIDYGYNVDIMPCAATAPNWVATGNTRCMQAGVNNNFNGETEKEEVDKNNCSETYLQRRWISIGVVPGNTCSPLAACTGNEKRVVVVNGTPICETAVKIMIESRRVYNVNNPNLIQWKCVFRYAWSDGFVSEEYVEISNTQCVVVIAD